MSCRVAVLPAILSFLVISNSCRDPETSSTEEAFLIHGQIWAYGAVTLTHPESLPSIEIHSDRGVKEVDTRLRGVRLAGTGGLGNNSINRDIAYVDYHPRKDKVLAYAYRLEATRSHSCCQRRSRHYSRSCCQRRSGLSYDVWAVLVRGGRSYRGRQRVFIGKARFERNANVAKVEMADGIRISKIAQGVFSGQWALHYPAIKRVVLKPWAGMCHGKLRKAGPGQSPGQTPTQSADCRQIPVQQDLCGGDPTQRQCRPNPPVVGTPAPDPDQGGEDSEITHLSDGRTEIRASGSVFSLAEGATHKFQFVFDRNVSSTEENGQICTAAFYAVARTTNGRINSTCRAESAPAQPVDGKLSCALNLKFQSAETYLERICDLTAAIRGHDLLKIQILRR